MIPPLTPEILAGIVEIGFTLYGSQAPPDVAVATVGGSFQLSVERRTGIAYSIQPSPGLAVWATVPGEETITGDTPYSFTQALNPGSLFFRVGLDDFLTPVPEVISP